MCSSTHKSLSLCLSPQAGPPYLDPREDPSSGDAEVKVGNELGSGHLVVIFKFLPRSIVGVKNGGKVLGSTKLAASCMWEEEEGEKMEGEESEPAYTHVRE